jgi:hypothetical protein
VQRCLVFRFPSKSLALSEVERVDISLIDWVFVATGLWPVHKQSRLTEPWPQDEIPGPARNDKRVDRVVLNAMLIQATKPYLFNIVFGEDDPPRFLHSARNDKEQAESW